MMLKTDNGNSNNRNAMRYVGKKTVKKYHYCVSFNLALHKPVLCERDVIFIRILLRILKQLTPFLEILMHVKMHYNIFSLFYLL